MNFFISFNKGNSKVDWEKGHDFNGRDCIKALVICRDIFFFNQTITTILYNELKN